jgi:hypothetical protein
MTPSSHWQGRHSCSIPKTIPHSLNCCRTNRAPTGTPPADLAGLDFARNRRTAADFRIAHVAPPPSVASQASPQAFANSRTRKM